MSTNFDRLRTQRFIERIVGCTSLENWPQFKLKLESRALTISEAADLKVELHLDGTDLFLKGLQSIAEAIASFRQCLFSWGTVKAYYSVFYFLRASLAMRDQAILRNNSLYLLRVNTGEMPQRKVGNRYRNDHIAVINIYRDIYAASDPLQSNNIAGENPYIWLMEKRNQIHYRERSFHDPSAPAFLLDIETSVKTGKFEDRLHNYIDDTVLNYPFLDTHAPLALPIARAVKTRNDFDTFGVSFKCPDLKNQMLHELICGDKSCKKDSRCVFVKLARVSL